MNKYDHSRDRYIIAVRSASTLSDVCRNLGIRPIGSNYDTVKRKITEYGIDSSHLSSRFAKPNPRFSTNPLGKPAIKAKLLREWGHVCQKCKLTEWLGEPITLELEHIDGDTSNNSYDNLTIFCPNCHSQTKTWRRRKSSLDGKGWSARKWYCGCGDEKAERSIRCMKCHLLSKKEGSNARGQRGPHESHCSCGNPKHKSSKRCKECFNNARIEKICWPSDQKLIEMLDTMSYVKVGRQLGVSDNAVRKRARNRGLTVYKS